MIGSDNLNRRSWTHDSELSIAVLDAHRDSREPVDPAGLGDGARTFARDLRLRAVARAPRPSRTTTPDDLLDPEAAFAAFAATAQALQDWYDGGQAGPAAARTGAAEHRPSRSAARTGCGRTRCTGRCTTLTAGPGGTGSAGVPESPASGPLRSRSWRGISVTSTTSSQSPPPTAPATTSVGKCMPRYRRDTPTATGIRHSSDGTDHGQRPPARVPQHEIGQAAVQGHGCPGVPGREARRRWGDVQPRHRRAWIRWTDSRHGEEHQSSPMMAATTTQDSYQRPSHQRSSRTASAATAIAVCVFADPLPNTVSVLSVLVRRAANHLSTCRSRVSNRAGVGQMSQRQPGEDQEPSHRRLHPAPAARRPCPCCPGRAPGAATLDRPRLAGGQRARRGPIVRLADRCVVTGTRQTRRYLASARP